MKKPLPAFTRAPHEHYVEYVEDLEEVVRDLREDDHGPYPDQCLNELSEDDRVDSQEATDESMDPWYDEDPTFYDRIFDEYMADVSVRSA